MTVINTTPVIGTIRGSTPTVAPTPDTTPVLGTIRPTPIDNTTDTTVTSNSTTTVTPATTINANTSIIPTNTNYANVTSDMYNIYFSSPSYDFIYNVGEIPSTQIYTTTIQNNSINTSLTIIIQIPVFLNCSPLGNIIYSNNSMVQMQYIIIANSITQFIFSLDQNISLSQGNVGNYNFDEQIQYSISPILSPNIPVLLGDN